MTTRRLEVDDILDLRAYERVRDDFRRRIIELKRRRRLALGPLLTVVFENIDTMRFQVQEMARAERIVTDEGIQHELDVYNRLLPDEGELSATLFVELTTEADLRTWLPKLVGIERMLAIEIGDPTELVVPSVPESSHAQALTRETVTAAVHYIRFSFAPEARARISGEGPMTLVACHPEYGARSVIPPEMRSELASDLEGGTEPLPFG